MKEEFIQTSFHSPDGHDLDNVWQLLYPEHFINVLLIHHIKQRDEKNIEEVAGIMRDGLMRYNESRSIKLMDPLYHEKFEILNISDMFKSFKSEDDSSVIEPKLILIDGAPGMGKTTLCKEIACQWAKGELLKDTRILFLLFLRDPAVQNMHNLTDFIQYFFKFKQSSLDISKKCAEILDTRDNSDITILMDGYNELRNKGNDLLIERIIKRKILPQCRIVITSRPIASEKLSKLADVKVEILGFNDKSKIEYIQKEFKDYPEKADCLLSYLNNHYNINKICYVPIMMAIMVCTFKEYEELPTNQSELYERFVTSVISRYLQKLDDTLPKVILSINKLPVRYQTYLQQLSEFAFKTIESDKIIFSNEDIENLSQSFALSNKELQGLGLFKATEQFSFKKIDNYIWYNFLHLCIHEFLAAYYLKSLEISEQFKILNQKLYMKHYTNVLVMFIGLQHNVTHEFHQFLTYSHIYGASDASKDEMKSILQNLYLLDFSKIKNINIKNVTGTFKLLCCKDTDNNLQSDVMHENFIKTYDSWCLFRFAYNWIRLSISLCSTTNSDQLIEVYLLDKNAQDISYHQAVTGLKQNQNLSVMLVSSDTIVGYRCNHHQLANALHINKSIENIILRYCLINNDIAKVLSSCYINCHNLQSLTITDCMFKRNQLAILVIFKALKENSKLKVLNLSRNNLTGQVADDLANVTKNNPSLEELYLSQNDLRSSATVILQALKENSQLKVLDLNSNNMTGQVAEDLANVIKNNSYLEKLGLENNNLGSSASVILQALKENSQLKVLDLDGNNMTGQVAEDLANIIKNNPSLEELYLSQNDLRSSATVILQALKENSQLNVLTLNGNNMTGQVAEDLANVIINNSYLEQLGLENNNLGPSATVILQALKENSQFKVLNLNSNSMTGQVAEDLANVIKNNSNLEELYLSQNDLRLSATVILQALKENSQLKVLNLNSNNMTGQVAEDLVNVIKNNPSLEELYLLQNDLRSSATVILQALKENSQLKVLNLNSNNMTGQVAEDLANVIKNNSYLEKLGLENNNLGPSATVILQALKENSQLKVLDLDGNNMTGQVAEDLANVIKNNSGLEELYLSRNDLRSSATVILQALKGKSKLKILYLHNNNMTGRVAEDLANVIKNNSYLEKLGLENNNLGPSATVILQALKENCQIKMLNLNKNNMTGQVAEDLANVIKNNPSLEELYLSKNDLRLSATVILQALKENSQLKVLDSDGNNMTGQVAEDLANVIKNNPSLEELHLSENDLRSSATVILQALKENSQLKVLNLNSNNMTRQVAEDLANVIKNNPSVEELYLSKNDLGSSATVILQALKGKSKLKILYLHNNNMTGQVAEDLANVLKNNPSLEGLFLSQNDLRSSATVILQALKQNSQLKVLNLGCNNMTGQVAEDLAIVIKNNLGLKVLCLYDNDLKSSGVVILQALKENCELIILNMSNNFLTKITTSQFVPIIKNNPLITEIWLGDNMLQSGLIDIAMSCNNLTNLRAIELSHNSISPTEVVHLASVVSNIKSLQVLIFGGLILNVIERFHLDVFQVYNASEQTLMLRMQNNSFIVHEMLEIVCLQMWRSGFVDRIKLNHGIKKYFPTVLMNYFVYMEPNLRTTLSMVKQSKQQLSELDGVSVIITLNSCIKTLKVLDLGYSNINKEAAVKLATALNCNNVLEQLWLRGNVLGADGAAAILSSLQNISTLRILDLSYNNISSTSANGIAAVINSNQFLEQLWLDGNMLMTTGVVIIASVLKKHSNLLLLSLSNNGITEDAAEEISAIVNSNTLLGGLLLCNNQLKSIGTCDIAKPLDALHDLHILELTNNCIDATAADELALVLSNCLCLRELYLGNNNLETTGAVKVCQALKNIQILRVLSLNNNNITTEAASEICDVISTNTNLGILLLGGNDLQTTGVLQIADTIKNNILSMQLLSLSDNNVNNQVKEDIKVMLCDECHLKLYV